MTNRMTQSTKGTFKKQWHKDSSVALIFLTSRFFNSQQNPWIKQQKKIQVETQSNVDKLTKKIL